MNMLTLQEKSTIISCEDRMGDDLSPMRYVFSTLSGQGNKLHSRCILPRSFFPYLHNQISLQQAFHRFHHPLVPFTQPGPPRHAGRPGYDCDLVCPRGRGLHQHRLGRLRP